eukprot:SAG11_NODE_1221_length_5486_cov_7.177650_6_plen_134_part_00
MHSDYCGTILVMAGFTDTSEAIWLTAAVSFVGFAFTNIGVLGVLKASTHTRSTTTICGQQLLMLEGFGSKSSALFNANVALSVLGCVCGSCGSAWTAKANFGLTGGCGWLTYPAGWWLLLLQVHFAEGSCRRR